MYVYFQQLNHVMVLAVFLLFSFLFSLSRPSHNFPSSSDPLVIIDLIKSVL